MSIINQIEQVDLSKNNAIDNLKKLYGSLGKRLCFQIEIPANCHFYRFVSSNGSGNVHDKDYLKYKPSHLNTIPQRASLANQTVFYGTISNNLSSETPDSINQAVWIGAAETSPNYRDCIIQNTYTDSKETFILSKWTNKKDIYLDAIVHPSVFPLSNNDFLSAIKSEYNKCISKVSDVNAKTNAELVAEFFAKKFQNRVSSDDEYKITALFADMLMSFPQSDGVIYPSVMVEGKFGMCVAIKPNVVDNSFDLECVKDVNVILDSKKKEFSVVDCK